MRYLQDHKREFVIWDEVKTTVLKNDKNDIYKGFYSLDEALIAVRTSVGPYYFISVLLKGKSIITTQNKTVQDRTYSVALIAKEKEEERRVKIETEKSFSAMINNLP